MIVEKPNRGCEAEESLDTERDGGGKCHGIAVMERWASTPQSRTKGLCVAWVTALLRSGVKTIVGKMVRPCSYGSWTGKPLFSLFKGTAKT